MQFLVFDTETTGLPQRTETEHGIVVTWPRLVQLGWIVLSSNYIQSRRSSYLIAPNGWCIPEEVVRIHGITNERAAADGEPIQHVLDRFDDDVHSCDYAVAHNFEFDFNVLDAECHRYNRTNTLAKLSPVCTMETARPIMRIPATHGYRRPNLARLAEYYFPGRDVHITHDALSDAETTALIFVEMIRQNHIMYAK